MNKQIKIENLNLNKQETANIFHSIELSCLFEDKSIWVKNQNINLTELRIKKENKIWTFKEIIGTEVERI